MHYPVSDIDMHGAVVCRQAFGRQHKDMTGKPLAYQPVDKLLAGGWAP